MLTGINRALFRKTLLSVGEARSAVRPLSPVEVGTVFHVALKTGLTLKEIGTAFQLDSSMVARFLRIIELPSEIHHLIDWGQSKEYVIGFSTASELCRAPPRMQGKLAAAILKYRATKEEAISIIQLVARSGEKLDKCVARVMGRRPTVRLLHVAVGSITSTGVQARLASLPQLQRDRFLGNALRRLYPKMKDYSAKLGYREFTVVGDKSVADSIGEDQSFEANVNEVLAKCLKKASASKGTS